MLLDFADGSPSLAQYADIGGLNRIGMKIMTPKEFIAKFPNAERNCNCLTDIACPECGSRGRFDIEIKTTAKFGDEGSEDTSDMEWEDGMLQVAAHAGTAAQSRPSPSEGSMP